MVAASLTMAHKPASFLVALSILVCCSRRGGGAVAKAVPTALEASYKDRIWAILNGSAEAAADHLKKRLALGAGAQDNVFGGYELEIEQARHPEEAKWLHTCTQVDSTRDSVENCALRQLQALVALCDVPDIFKRDEDARTLAEQHVTTLLKMKKVSALGLSLSTVSGASLFFHQKSPGAAADDVDVSPTVQASVLMAVVRCGEALGLKTHMDEAETWFIGLGKVYPQSIWNQSMVSFHKLSIMWESLSVIASHVSRSSSFHEDILEYLGRFEVFLRQAWEESPESWSFASARALALRWQSKGLKKKRRTMLKRWAEEHVDRFLGRHLKTKGSLSGVPEKSVSEGILAKIGGAGYTCGPLQGLAALAAVLNDPELIQVVLQLLEKDIKHYQLSEASSGPFKEKVGPSVMGAFFRDEQQMKMERRQSLRVDDTAMCLIAMTQALEVLEGIQGVVVGDSAPVKAKSAASSTEL